MGKILLFIVILALSFILINHHYMLLDRKYVPLVFVSESTMSMHELDCRIEHISKCVSKGSSLMDRGEQWPTWDLDKIFEVYKRGGCSVMPVEDLTHCLMKKDPLYYTNDEYRQRMDDLAKQLKEELLRR